MKKTTQTYLVNSMILFAGIGFSGLSFILNNPRLEIILLGVGCSVIASSIVSFLNGKYLISTKTSYNKVVETWGLVDIHEFRSQCNQHINDLIRKSNYMEICAYGLNSLRQNMGKEIEIKVKNGFKMRIITYNPDSQLVTQREKELGETTGSIKKSIYNCIDWANELKKLQSKSGNVEILLYDGLHLNHYLKVGNSIFTGPYFLGKDGQQTITYEISKKGIAFDYYSSVFEDLWAFLKGKNDDIK